MRLISTITLGALWGVSLSAAVDSSVPGESNRTQVVCRLLQIRFPGTIFLPGSPTYDAEHTDFWSAEAQLLPACIFVPTNSRQVADAVKTFAATKTTFAVRGGGHMPIPGYAGTNDGVLVALTKLNGLTLSRDKSVLSVGPGRTWGEVYTFLEPHGLIAVGGRVGAVGVPGLILGGGISFYSSQHGFASDNVIAFEVVLGSGRIVTATARQEPDLFWALKGGANNFGVVTRFDLRTYSSPTVCAGLTQLLPGSTDAFLRAITNFGSSTDPKAAIIPITVMLNAQITIHAAVLFYDGADCDQPALAEFNAIPAAANTYGNTTLAAYVATTDSLNPTNVRQRFQIFSSYATAQAVQILHEITMGMVPEIADVAGFQVSMSFQPVTRSFIQQGVHKGGNPQAVDIAKAPYFWTIHNFSWSDASADARIAEFMTRIRTTINERLAAAGQKAPYLYLNDADAGQEVFQNYGPGSLARLHKVRSRYDPDLIFTRLVPGGWKLPDL